MAKKGIKNTQIFTNVLQDTINYRLHMMDKTIEISNFLTTVSGIILTVALGKMSTEGFPDSNPMIKLGVFAIVVASLLTISVSLLIIEPESRKRERKTSLFSYGVDETMSKDKYGEFIRGILNNDNKTVQSYGDEMHKLDSVIRKRFYAIRSISIVLLLGIVVGGVLILLSTLGLSL